MPSDSEVIIASETDGTRHKVIINPSARIKRPKCTPRAPLMMTSVKVSYIEHSEQDEKYHMRIVKDVNERKTTWKAVYNKFASRSRDYGFMLEPEYQKTYMLRNIVLDRNATFEELVGDTMSHVKELADMSIDLPKSFDAREKWPFCESIHRVVNQGGCGSCYAVAATSVISDRICIKSKGKSQPFISSQDLISCCKDCGGCHGTVWALLSFNHWRDHGIVSGGAYGSLEGCIPYRHAPNCGSPCSIDVYSKKKNDMECRKKCQPLYSKNYDDDLHKAKSVYWIKVNKVTVANIEQLKPVANITKGIYESQTSPLSKDLYGHCAKLIGWGEESGVKYWTYMNTWGRDFGLDGFFKTSEDPEEVAAGIPF
ncbi:hypothetical protein FO519_005855 [Halicephalobus sp. NKZ332]|nr:hypothetical protein FO519_005855 [Halicephalobus sp. NKZ332]